MRHQTIALIGGTGFIGRDLVNRLVKDGRHVRIATRRRAHAAALSMFPVEILEVDVYDPVQLAAFIHGADAVVNLAGILHSRRGEPYGPDFARVHVELPKKIAAACVAEGVPRLLHMSALGARSDGTSMYLRSKGDGELVVRSANGLHTTIFRPSVVFGPGDSFINIFAGLQRNFPMIPLASSQARFQPVYVGDVANAVLAALDRPEAAGQTYELGGPRIYSFAELMRLMLREIDRPTFPLISIPFGLASFQAAILEHLPGKLLTRDQVMMLKRDNVVSPGARTIEDLGITPTAPEVVLQSYLERFRTGGRFSPRHPA